MFIVVAFIIIIQLLTIGTSLVVVDLILNCQWDNSVLLSVAASLSRRNIVNIDSIHYCLGSIKLTIDSINSCLPNGYLLTRCGVHKHSANAMLLTIGYHLNTTQHNRMIFASIASNHCPNNSCVDQMKIFREFSLAIMTDSIQTMIFSNLPNVAMTPYLYGTRDSIIDYDIANPIKRYFSNGECQLWWPLNNSELYVYTKQSLMNSRSTTEKIILACSNQHDKYELIVSINDGMTRATAPIGTWGSPIDYHYDVALSSHDLMSMSKRLDIRICSISHKEQCAFQGTIYLSLVIHEPASTAGAQHQHKHQVPPMVNQIPNRDEFGYALSTLLSRDRTSHVMVEVGVHKGEFAEKILRTWPDCTRYIMVDPWAPPLLDSREYVDLANIQDSDEYEFIYQTAKQRVKLFEHKTLFMRMTSHDAADHIEDDSVDVVYIDAMHDYYSVLHDIEIWWPKVLSGGLLAGHDYELGYSFGTIFTVKPAVDMFARKHNIPVYQTQDHELPTWFFIKP